MATDNGGDNVKPCGVNNREGGQRTLQFGREPLQNDSTSIIAIYLEEP